MSREALKTIVPFLDPQNQRNVRYAALTILLELTASIDGRLSLYENNPEIIKSVVNLLGDSDASIAKNSLVVLVNISSDERGTKYLLEKREVSGSKEDLLPSLLNVVLDPESELGDHACAILANVTRYPEQSDQVFEFLEGNCDKFPIKKLVSIFTSETSYNKANCLLDHLAFFFANLSQSKKFRSILLNDNDSIFERFLPFIGYEKSVIRRSGTVALVKNCCFNWENHEWLLNSANVLPHLLLPLAGPEEFDDEDNEKLPVDLQYLPEGKTREAVPSIRKSLLETLLLLCSTKKCRTFIRDHNSYIILRELHKWEKDEEALLACENVVDVLIRTEDEIGVDNLHEVEVPSDLQEKFDKLDLENSTN